MSGKLHVKTHMHTRTHTTHAHTNAAMVGQLEPQAEAGQPDAQGPKVCWWHRVQTGSQGSTHTETHSNTCAHMYTWATKQRTKGMWNRDLLSFDGYIQN